MVLGSPFCVVSRRSVVVQVQHALLVGAVLLVSLALSPQFCRHAESTVAATAIVTADWGDLGIH